MTISFEKVGNLGGGGGYYFVPVDGARYRMPAGQYELFGYKKPTAANIFINHSKHSASDYSLITEASGGVTTPDGVEWIKIWGAEKAIIMPTDQLDKRVPDLA